MRALLVCVLLALPLCAQHEHHAPPPDVATELPPGLGNNHYPITTKSTEAQTYFDQGLMLLYGFNHDEAPARCAARSGCGDGVVGARTLDRAELMGVCRSGSGNRSQKGRESEAKLVEQQFRAAWKDATSELTVEGL
jgi:hypothetical protein